LLTDDIEDPAVVEEANNAVAPLNQFSDDDFEEEELLTAGLDDDAPSDEVVENVSPTKPALVVDDDSIEDENLLSD
jgi:secreted protein with Ig-like and vWFA domain